MSKKEKAVTPKSGEGSGDLFGGALSDELPEWDERPVVVTWREAKPGSVVEVAPEYPDVLVGEPGDEIRLPSDPYVASLLALLAFSVPAEIERPKKGRPTKEVVAARPTSSALQFGS